MTALPSPPRSMASASQGVNRRSVIPTSFIYTVAWSFLAVLAVALLIYVRGSIEWLIVAPLMAALAIVIGFLLYLRRIEGTLPYFEIGAFYISIATIYMVYPLFKYVLQGNRYDSGDHRIVAVAPYPSTLATLAWWFVLYLGSFCIVYSVVRGRRARQGRIAVTRPGWPMVASILILLAGTRLFFSVLGLFFDMRVNEYLDRYLVILRLPLVIRQIAAQVQGIELTLQVMLVVALISGRRKSFRVLLAIFLMVMTLSHLLAPGGRIHLVVVIIASLAAHHLIVRRLPFRWMLVAAITGFVVLMVMAAVRSDQSIGTGQLRGRLSDNTEFEVILGNAVDLKYIHDAEGVFLTRPNLYWSGLLALAPQQIVPVTKDDPAAWFARNYYPAFHDSGGGLAFGVLAEAVAGYGWPEMLWRAALVGVAFALVHRALHRPRVSVYFFAFSIWLTAWSYTTIRAGTFALLMMIMYRIVVPVVAVKVLTLLLQGRTRRLRESGMPAELTPA